MSVDVTKRLMELDPTLELHNEGHWDKPLDPGMPGFTSFNDAGVETETGEFLYAMVRLLKPRRVLETGTHIGVGMAYMGQALKDNREGKLVTIEFLHEIYARALERRNTLQLEEYVDIIFGDVAKFDPHYYATPNTPVSPAPYDFMLLDTEPQTRFAELIKFYPHLKPGGYVFIHDLHRHMHQIPNEEHGFAWPYGVLPEEIKKLVRDGDLRPFHFPTPRGLTGFYKVDKENDYDWGTHE